MRFKMIHPIGIRPYAAPKRADMPAIGAGIPKTKIATAKEAMRPSKAAM